MTTASDMKDRILNRASEDGEFRARLIADPKGAISAEVGADIPEGFDVAVHEDSATAFHLVLPPSPELTETDLEKIAGGHHTGLWG